MRSRTKAGFAVGLLVALAAGSAQAILLPPEAIVLHQIHVQFEWPAVGGADEYQLQVVEDDGSPDPFASAIPVVDVTVPATDPRAAVTSGLMFDELWAWRVREIVLGTPGAWGSTHRFETAALPGSLPAITVTPGVGTPEPGLTMFNIGSTNGTIAGGIAIAVDAAGNPVWFLEQPDGFLDLRLLDTGRILSVSGLFAGTDRAREHTQNGQLAWISPNDPDLRAHHEAFPMPGGNVLTIVYTYAVVSNGGAPELWRGDRYVELDRTTNQVVWDWNTFDHFSTLDFDPSPGTLDLGDGAFNWTHTNAVVYNAADDSVYVSVRHLSRVTRIDYSTQAIVYNMGFDMPSGDPDFGDNLFSFQHAPQLLANGNMMLFDNGNRRDHLEHTPATGVSKALELAFTGTPPTGASIDWEWTLPAYQAFVGDTDRLPGGNTLVTAGVSAKLYEIDAAGAEVWRLELPTGVPTYVIYRAERIAALLVDGPGDSDGDGLTDDADNCPDHANADQADCDGDGFGDVCTAALGLSRCDDGLDNDGDGLTDGSDPGCACADDPSERSAALVCDDEVDDDGDGLAAAPEDPGCDDPSDPSERSASLVCDNGIDDDLDGLTDFVPDGDGDGLPDPPGDIGCRDPTWPLEDPECADEVDNDGDGAVDFLGIDLNGDGDFDDPGEFPPDPQCTSPSKNRERPTPPGGGGGPGCGAGAELVLLLGAGLWWRRQRVGRTYSTA
ncbi:MAG: aryl-sulfate sulfotransferase [Proteobacteria bacterium]|nr:aryl-sulfate sulfotransferase [Pseudomonadota bacterium]